MDKSFFNEDNLRDVITHTYCKLNINYVNERDRMYKYFYFMEFFYKNEDFIREFISRLRIDSYHTKTETTLKLNGTGENKILYVFEKNPHNIEQLEYAENPFYCNITKQVNDKIINNTPLNMRYRKFFIDLMFKPFDLKSNSESRKDENVLANENGLYYEDNDFVMLPNIILKYVTINMIEPLRYFKRKKHGQEISKEKIKGDTPEYDFQKKVLDQEKAIEKHRGKFKEYKISPLMPYTKDSKKQKEQRNLKYRMEKRPVHRDRSKGRSWRSQKFRMEKRPVHRDRSKGRIRRSQRFHTEKRPVHRNRSKGKRRISQKFRTEKRPSRQVGGSREKMLDYLEDIVFEVLVLPDDTLCEEIYLYLYRDTEMNTEFKERIKKRLNNLIVKEQERINNMNIYSEIHRQTTRRLLDINNSLESTTNPQELKHMLNDVLYFLLSKENYSSLHHLNNTNLAKLKRIRANIYNFFKDNFDVEKETIKIEVSDIHSQNNWIGIKVSYRNVYRGNYKYVRLTNIIRGLSLDDVIDKLEYSQEENSNTSVFDNYIYRTLNPNSIETYGIQAKGKNAACRPMYSRQPRQRFVYEQYRGENQITESFVINNPFLINLPDNKYGISLEDVSIEKIFYNRILENTSLCSISLCCKLNNDHYIIDIVPSTNKYVQKIFNRGDKRDVHNYLHVNTKRLEEDRIIENDNTRLLLFYKLDLKYEITITKLLCHDCNGNNFTEGECKDCRKVDGKKCEDGTDRKYINKNKNYKKYLTRASLALESKYYITLIEDYSSSSRYREILKKKYKLGGSLLLYNIIYAFFQFIIKKKNREWYYQKFRTFISWVVRYDTNNGGVFFRELFSEFINGNMGTLERSNKIKMFNNLPFICVPSRYQKKKYTLWYMFLEVNSFITLEAIFSNYKDHIIKKNIRKMEKIKMHIDDFSIITGKGNINIFRETVNSNNYLFNIYSLLNYQNNIVSYHEHKKKLDSFLNYLELSLDIAKYLFYYHSITLPDASTFHLHIVEQSKYHLDFSKDHIPLRKFVMYKNALHEHTKYMKVPYYKFDLSFYHKHYIQLDNIEINKFELSEDDKNIVASVIDRMDKNKINADNFIDDYDVRNLKHFFDINDSIILKCIDIIDAYVTNKKIEQYGEYSEYIKKLYHPNNKISTYNFINIIIAINNITN